MKPKRELVRVVKAPTAEDGSVKITLDLTGKEPGRGAYVCLSAECFEKARKSRRFERSLSCKIPEDVYEQMNAAIGNAEQR